MQTFQLKTWSPKHKNTPHQLFLLAKGNNTGKPLERPCPNCFVITCCRAAERERLYWLSFVLWQSRIFRHHLIGSVIEFIHIGDLRRLLRDYDRQLSSNLSDYVSMLTRLNQVEVNLKDQLSKTRMLKLSLAQEIIKPR